MASDATGETGDMFMYGGMTSDATVPSQTARVLCVDATTSGGAPPANMFEWFAVASGEQEKGVNKDLYRHHKAPPTNMRSITNALLLPLSLRQCLRGNSANWSTYLRRTKNR